MKQVLIYSIQPEHVLNFLKGLKSDEIRKRDLPQWAKDKLDRGEVVQGYGYCTKGKPYLEPRECNGEFVWNIHNDFIYHTDLNGKVVLKFQVSGTTKYVDCSGCTNNENGYECENDFMYLLSVDPILRKATCLEADELEAYGNGADLYAHHFTNIQPIEPMELSNFYKQVPFFEIRDKEKYLFEFGKYAVRDKEKIDEERKLTKAPQSFMTAWVKGE